MYKCAYIFMISFLCLTAISAAYDQIFASGGTVHSERLPA